MTPSPSMNPERSDAILGMLRSTVADDQDARVAASRRRRTRGILIASMSAAVVVVAAGVGYGVTAGSRSTAPGDGDGLAVPTSEPAAPSPSSSPTSSLPPGVDPAGTATPVPTPAANTPTDPSTWTITTAGIGPMKPGMALSAADAAARAAGLTQTDCGAGVGLQGTHFYDLPDGTQLIAQTDGDHATTFTIAGSLEAKAPVGEIATPHGIHIGSSSDALKATYTDLVPPKFPLYPGETGYGLSDGAGHWIDFVISDASDTVQEILVNTDNVVPSEVCG